jgi:hypothetical protein
VNIGVVSLLTRVKVFSCKCSLSQVEHKAIKVLNYRRTSFVEDHYCVVLFPVLRKRAFGLSEPPITLLKL